MDAPEGLGFLLIADLHIGDPDSKLTDPEYRDELDRDLRREHEKTGPWDVVFIAGGLTSPRRRVPDELVWDTVGSLVGPFVGLDRVLFVPGREEPWRQPTRESTTRPPFVYQLEANGLSVAVLGVSEVPHDLDESALELAEARLLLARSVPPELEHTVGFFRAHFTGGGEPMPDFAARRIVARSLLGNVPKIGEERFGYASGRVTAQLVLVRPRSLVESRSGPLFVDDVRVNDDVRERIGPFSGQSFAEMLEPTKGLPDHVVSQRRWGPILDGLSQPKWSEDGTAIAVVARGSEKVTSQLFHPADGKIVEGGDARRARPKREHGPARLQAETVYVLRQDGRRTVVLDNVRATALTMLERDSKVVVAVENELVVATADGVLLQAFAAHNDPCTAITATPDGRLLASISAVGEIALWRTADWCELARWTWDGSSARLDCIAFSPEGWSLAVCQHDNLEVLSIDPLILTLEATVTPASVTAKVVLVGRGSVGKTSLAHRLVEDEYAEHPSTHGMQFWSFAAPSPDETRREVVLWDLGGQSEYWLLHQLFLPETELALLLVEPRAQDYEDVAKWAARLALVDGVTTVLVATKIDAVDGVVDAAALDRVARAHGCAETIQTSAKTGAGRAILLDTIAARVRWDALELSRRGRAATWLFEHLERQRGAGRVFVSFGELEAALPEDVDRGDLGTAVGQLARRGRIANVRSQTGQQFVVLRIEEIERYAGSLILAARDQPSGVAALDAAAILGPGMDFPRIADDDRLARPDEWIVLDCVVDMLVRQGIAILRHGQLVFPHLFATAGSDEKATPARTTFDLGGGVDDAYATLVARLTMAEAYGAPRMSRGAARFSRAGFGTCGVRRVEAGEGRYAGLAVFFEDGADETTEAAFVCFVEEHLRQSGLQMVERTNHECHHCGRSFEPEAVKFRIAAGKASITCQFCDADVTLALGTDQARRRDAALVVRTREEQRQAEENRRQGTRLGKHLMGQGGRDRTSRWILVISDLHVPADADIETMAQALLEDVRNPDGPHPNRIGAIVVCGDLTNRATAKEFEQAHALIGVLANELECTPKNTMIVPGNHDIDWAHPGVYRDHTGARPGNLSEHEFIARDGITLVRDHAAYCDSFGRFSTGIYETFYQRAYPKQPGDQVEVLDVPDLGVTFVGFNSAWNTAKYTPNAATITDAAITTASKKLQALPQDRLRIAVWHHPITGNEKIQQDAFVERLRNAGVRLCLHGHVHENRADLLNYLHPRKMHVVGTGSFGAPWEHRVESTPRLYHLLELRDDRKAMRVHTRQLAKTGGAWEPFYHWPDPTDAGKRLPHFDVTF